MLPTSKSPMWFTAARLTDGRAPGAHGPGIVPYVRGVARTSTSERVQSSKMRRPFRFVRTFIKNLEQPGHQSSSLARPPVLKAAGRISGAGSAPECTARIMRQRVGVGKRTILLSNGKDVQSEPAPQTMSSSTSVTPDSSTGAMRASAHRSRKVLLVLCSSS